MERPTIFVSHAWADNDLTRQYVDGLHDRGYDVWADLSGLEVGAHVSEEITTQLNARDALIVLWTPNSVHRPNVLEECHYFLKRLPDWPHKRFIPVHAVDSHIAAHLQLGLTPESVLETFGPDQYLYVDGRQRSVAETMDEIVAKLEEPTHVPPPFRLDSLNELELVARIEELCARKYPTVAEPRVTDARADLVVIKPDELLGGGDVIVVELKQYRTESTVSVETVHRLEHYVRSTKAAQGWLMTNRQFTREVLDYAENHHWLRLFDRERLVWLFRQHGFRVTTESR
jgi:hypothetical protein